MSTPICNNFIQKVVEGIVPQPAHATPPSETLCSNENEMMTRFNTTESGARFFLKFIEHYSFRAAPFTLYEILCYNLYQTLEFLQGWVQKESYHQIKTDFLKGWVGLVIDPERKSEPFAAFLGSLIKVFLRAHSQKENDEISSQLIERKRNECREIIEQLQSTTKFLIPLLEKMCQSSAQG